ncbi:MAG: hypothetical protein ABFS17_00490 [Chloroflexota bacterium]
MDIFFNDPNDVPLPPDQIEVRELTGTPNQEGNRVLVNFEITPFQDRPNIEVALLNEAGKQAAAFSVVEAIENKMDFTLHLRDAETKGKYTLLIEVIYTDLSTLDEAEGPPIQETIANTKRVVASAKSTFEIK